MYCLCHICKKLFSYMTSLYSTNGAYCHFSVPHSLLMAYM